MRGKTKDEARAELEKEGVSGDRLERILPHKVNARGNSPPPTPQDLYLLLFTIISHFLYVCVCLSPLPLIFPLLPFVCLLGF